VTVEEAYNLAASDPKWAADYKKAVELHREAILYQIQGEGEKARTCERRAARIAVRLNNRLQDILGQ